MIFSLHCVPNVPKSLSRTCYYYTYITDVESNIAINSKYFWNFIKSSKRPEDLPNSLFFNDEASVDLQVIANLFAKYFSSVYEHNTHYSEFQYSNTINPSRVIIQ